MKKTSLLIITLCLLTGMLFAFTACSSHEHTPFWQNASTPTCTTDGARFQQCSECGERLSENEIVPATGHTEETTPGKAATCTEDGKSDIISCSTCGHRISGGDTIPKLGHSYVDSVCTACGQNEFGKLCFELSEDGTYYVVSRGTYFGETLVIPESYEGLPVKEIKANGFSDYSSVKYLTVPESIVKIGEHAFDDSNDSSALRSLTILGPCHIGDSAFSGCTSLATLDLGNKTVSIGDGAFAATSITELTVPASVTELGVGSFRSCKRLDEIVFAEDSPIEVIPDGCFDLGKLVYGQTYNNTSLTLPKGLKRIEQNAFRVALIEELVLPEGLVHIGQEAFSEAVFTILNLPVSLETIGWGAFQNVPIESATLPFIGASRTGEKDEGDLSSASNTQELDYIFGVGHYGGRICNTLRELKLLPGAMTVFNDCGISSFNSLIWLKLPEGLESIGRYALLGSQIRSIELPSTLNFIDSTAFSDDNHIVEIINHSNIWLTAGDADNGKIAKNVIYLEQSYAAIGVTSKLYLGEDEILYLTYGGIIVKYVGNATELTIGTDGKYNGSSIAAGAFSDCKTLEKLTIGKGITGIGDSAFSGCTALKEVYIDNQSPITELIGTFRNCTALTTVTLPAKLTTLTLTFRGCTNLVSLTIPQSVHTMLAPFDYANLAKLEGVIYADGIYYLSGWAIGFNYREVPEELTLQKVAKGIAAGTLNCDKIKKLTIPDSVQYICFAEDYAAFNSDLVELSIPFLGFTESTPCMLYQLYNSSFGSLSHISLKIINIYGGQIADNAFNMATTLESVTLEYRVTLIGDYAFQRCTSLNAVKIGTGVKAIGNSAFAGCSSLASVTFDEAPGVKSSLESLGTAVFYECSSLGGVAFPEKITRVPERTFFGCTSIEGVIMGAPITEIGEEAFYGCTGIKWIVLPYTLKSIDNNAFYGCTSLAKFYYGADAATWATLDITLPNNTVLYYYSATEPTDTEGYYWFPNPDNGLPIEW